MELVAATFARPRFIAHSQGYHLGLPFVLGQYSIAGGTPHGRVCAPRWTFSECGTFPGLVERATPQALGVVADYWLRQCLYTGVHLLVNVGVPCRCRGGVAGEAVVAGAAGNTNDDAPECKVRGCQGGIASSTAARSAYYASTRRSRGGRRGGGRGGGNGTVDAV